MSWKTKLAKSAVDALGNKIGALGDYLKEFDPKTYFHGSISPNIKEFSSREDFIHFGSPDAAQQRLEDMRFMEDQGKSDDMVGSIYPVKLRAINSLPLKEEKANLPFQEWKSWNVDDIWDRISMDLGIKKVAVPTKTTVIEELMEFAWESGDIKETFNYFSSEINKAKKYFELKNKTDDADKLEMLYKSYLPNNKMAERLDDLQKEFGYTNDEIINFIDEADSKTRKNTKAWETYLEYGAEGDPEVGKKLGLGDESENWENWSENDLWKKIYGRKSDETDIVGNTIEEAEKNKKLIAKDKYNISSEEIEKNKENFEFNGVPFGKADELYEGGKKQWLIDFLDSKGYDSIEYVNKVEDPGSISKIVFEPEQIRSPFAKFDPRKRKSRNILASGVGGVSLGALGAIDGQSSN